MATYTLDVTQQLTVQDCCVCGMTFGVPARYDRDRQEDHRVFYCPTGHSQSYVGKTEAQKQRERAERAERQLANREDDLRVERMHHDAERRSHAATKGQLTRVRKRAEQGVCLHCHRHFANVKAHVARQHPEAAGE